MSLTNDSKWLTGHLPNFHHGLHQSSGIYLKKLFKRVRRAWKPVRTLKFSDTFLENDFEKVRTMAPEIRRELSLPKFKDLVIWYSPDHPGTLIVAPKSTNRVMIRRMIIRCDVLRKLYCENYDRVIKVVYLPTKHKKLLPPFRRKFEAKHVNSGYTILSNKTSESVIFREEEAERTLVHEVIHQLGVDNRWPARIREVVTETMTCILHSMFNALVATRWAVHLGHEFYQFLEYLRVEQNFSLLQSGKLIRHFGLKDIRHFNPSAADEGPAVVEYHFLKAALLFKPSIYAAAAMAPTDTVRVLRRAIADPDFQAAVNRAIEFRPGGFLGRTMRMTAIELEPELLQLMSTSC